MKYSKFSKRLKTIKNVKIMGHFRLRSVVRLVIKNNILRDGLVKSKLYMSRQSIVFNFIIKFKSQAFKNTIVNY